MSGKSALEIWKGLSPGMQRELVHAVIRQSTWPYPRDLRSSRGLERHGLVTLTDHPLSTTEQAPTDTGRAVAEHGRKHG